MVWSNAVSPLAWCSLLTTPIGDADFMRVLDNVGDVHGWISLKRRRDLSLHYSVPFLYSSFYKLRNVYNRLPKLVCNRVACSNLDLPMGLPRREVLTQICALLGERRSTRGM
ncbi:hypothetical protein GCK72_024368 [Caenorhabditis remanei]|uniref:Uncharacterized protein n=1 Tax=Caenorhabditis remanei TaxID=31234 RepID=A0A6A5FZN0_CAERE|nr:hypothetical protein GCK72_024368 [Caenorhabditis remanei]KAF1747902.1 hypothetical protein GCK72_024368 [Caenorhabditis remanei]